MTASQHGFTLIELVIVMVLLGILGAAIVPRYIDLSDQAGVAAEAGMSGAVKSAYAIAVADLQGQPTVTQLATYVQGSNVTAVATGIDVGDIDGDSGNGNEIVPTYTDNTCGTATALVTNTVLCVGDIP